MKVLLFPGLGSDARLFNPLLEAINLCSGSGQKVEIYSLENSAPKSGQSLSDYAAELVEEQNMYGHYDLIIGVSMGGMIAQELIATKKISTTAMILISTASSGRDLSFSGRLAVHLLYLTPRILGGIVLRIFLFLYPLFRRHVVYVPVMIDMVKNSPLDLLLNGGMLIRKWRKDNIPYLYDIFVLRIHGKKDPLIDYKKVIRFDSSIRPIEKGNHIIIVTDVEKIASEIESFLADLRRREAL